MQRIPAMPSELTAKHVQALCTYVVHASEQHDWRFPAADRIRELSDRLRVHCHATTESVALPRMLLTPSDVRLLTMLGQHLLENVERRAPKRFSDDVYLALGHE